MDDKLPNFRAHPGSRTKHIQLAARRRHLRHRPPFSLTDIGRSLQRFLWSHSNPRGEHSNSRGDVISAARAANIWQWKWQPILKVSPPSGQLRNPKDLAPNGIWWYLDNMYRKQVWSYLHKYGHRCHPIRCLYCLWHILIEICVICHYMYL
jgi:hypothetical protein